MSYQKTSEYPSYLHYQLSFEGKLDTWHKTMHSSVHKGLLLECELQMNGQPKKLKPARVSIWIRQKFEHLMKTMILKI